MKESNAKRHAETTEQAKLHAGEILKELDTNKDGILDHKELLHHYRRERILPTLDNPEKPEFPPPFDGEDGSGPIPSHDEGDVSHHVSGAQDDYKAFLHEENRLYGGEGYMDNDPTAATTAATAYDNEAVEHGQE